MRTIDFPTLRSLIDIFVHDRQVGYFDPLPFAFRIEPRNPPPGVGVFHHAHTIPNEYASVDFVEDDPVVALLVSVNGRRGPVFAARRADALFVEGMSNLPRGLSGHVIPENTSGNVGLILDDREFAPLA